MTDLPDDEFVTEDIIAEQERTPPLSRKPEQEADPEPERIEPTVDEQDEEEEKPDEADKPAGDPDKRKFVPHAKFHEANERAKEANRRAQLVEERADRMLQMIQQQIGQGRQEQQPAPKDEIPEPGDFVGRLEYVLGKVDGIEKQTKQQAERQQQEQQGIELGRRVLSATQRDFAAASADDPTIQEAYDHLTASRVKELMAVRGCSKAEAEEQYKQEELVLYHEALQRQERPSAVVKRLAEARGWAPKPAGQQEQQQEQRRPGGQVTEERKSQHRSLSQMGGHVAPSRLTAKDLGKMSEDDFAMVPERIINQLMGGR